jgi:hypothetical protein
MTSGDAMDIGDLRASAAVSLSYVKSLRYPASKQHVVEKARSAGAPTGVMEVFNRIADRQYVSSLDLMKEIDNVVLISAYKKNISGGLDLPGSA